MNELTGAPDTDDVIDIDVAVIGAGFAGLYALYKLRNDLGLDVQAFDNGSDVGGSWVWNRSATHAGELRASPDHLAGSTVAQCNRPRVGGRPQRSC